MRRLLLVRHAQSEWNAAGRWQGSADPDLSPTGRDQADEAGRLLADTLAGSGLAGSGLAGSDQAGSGPAGSDLAGSGPVVALVASDLRRAVHTAAAIGAAVGWPAPPEELPGIREHDVGEWSGLTRDEIEARWPGMLEAWSRRRLERTPGGESRADFDSRVRATVLTLANRHADGLTIGVTHGGVLRAVARWLDLDDRPMANLEGYLLDAGDDVGGGTWLRHLGDVLLLARRPRLGREVSPALTGDHESP